MSKLFALTKRNVKEIFRDPLSYVFSFGFPVVLLVILSLVMSNLDGQHVPTNFRVENFSVGICVFGYTFDTLFIAIMIGADKNSEFLKRIEIAPVPRGSYLLSFACAIAPTVIAQTLTVFAISFIFGLQVSAKVLLAALYLMPSAFLYVSIGLLIGVLAKNEKQVGPFCSVLISFTSVFGGVFMDVSLLGKFENVLLILPFTHSVKIATGVFEGNFGCIWSEVPWVLGYAALFCMLAVFLKERKK